MSGNGEIFLDQAREMRTTDMGILVTSRYFEAQMSTDDANSLGWDEFRDRIRPIGTATLSGSNLECLVVPKTVPWGSEDVTVFVGEDNRQINEIDDLTEHEGRDFLGFNFKVARALIDKTDRRNVQVSIGFNPQDLSIGHHTVLRLHSHIRSINDDDIARRQTLGWSEMDRFSRLSFIEPFASLYHDYIGNAVQAGDLADLLVGEPSMHTGYTTMLLGQRDKLEMAFDSIKYMYQGMKAEYEMVVNIFSDGTIDAETGRLVPRPRYERESLLDDFLTLRKGLYSDRSVRVLEYLAKHIRKAAPKEYPTDISNAAKAYITRGFAGGMTFAFSTDKVVRFDFMPRVITTSAVAKTMLGQGRPTRIDKTEDTVSEAEKAIAERYYQDVLKYIK